MTLRYKAYLIDLDGTIYKGKDRIPSAEKFIERLQLEEIPFLFVTNNATKTPQEVADNLANHYHITVSPDLVYTSGVATTDYIKEHITGQKAFVIGEKALKEQLQLAGYQVVDQDPDFIVQALDRELTYQKLEKATLAIREGLPYIVTNGDTNMPTERGFVPGSGAITAFLRAATQTEPIMIGKPSPIIMQGALDKLNHMLQSNQEEATLLSKEDLVMVGDNYQTDILAGIDFGMDTLMVLTGFSTLDDIKGKEKRKTVPSKEGTLGVEGMPADVLTEAFAKAGVGNEACDTGKRLITKLDLYEDGFTGGSKSRSYRDELKKRLGLPSKLSSTSLICVLNTLCTYEEYKKMAEEIKNGKA